MDDIDLTRDTERETAVNINLKHSAVGKKEIFLNTNILPCNVVKRKHRLCGGAALSGHTCRVIKLGSVLLGVSKTCFTC